MTVQDLIDALEAVEDKSLPVCIYDYRNDGLMPSFESAKLMRQNAKHYTNDSENIGPYIEIK